MKKAECWRIDAFERWCWRRPLRVPWTARRSNQSILKEISPGCSLEGLILKLKLQYIGHLIQRVDSLEKPWCWEGLGAWGEGDDRGWDGWMASPTWWTWVGKLWALVMDKEAWHAVIHEVAKSQTWLSDWTKRNWTVRYGESSGTPLQYSCLENPRDGGAWWAAVYGVARVGHDWSNLAASAAATIR